MIYFTLLRIPTAATVSGYVRCAHVALAIPLSMLAYLPQCRKTAGGGGEMQLQSQMQVAIRSMRAVRFGDSKKLVLHTWPARPPTRSYQGPRLGRPLVLPETEAEAETHSGSTLAVSHGHASDYSLQSTLRWRFLQLLWQRQLPLLNRIRS